MTRAKYVKTSKPSEILYERVYQVNKETIDKIVAWVVKQPHTDYSLIEELPSCDENTMLFKLSPSWTITAILCLIEKPDEYIGNNYHWRCHCFLVNNVSVNTLPCSHWTVAQKRSVATVFKAMAEGYGVHGSNYHLKGNRLVGLKAAANYEVGGMTKYDIDTRISEFNSTSQKQQQGEENADIHSSVEEGEERQTAEGKSEG